MGNPLTSKLIQIIIFILFWWNLVTDEVDNTKHYVVLFEIVLRYVAICHVLITSFSIWRQALILARLLGQRIDLDNIKVWTLRWYNYFIIAVSIHADYLYTFQSFVDSAAYAYISNLLNCRLHILSLVNCITSSFLHF